jgi:hypothetical protein
MAAPSQPATEEAALRGPFAMRGFNALAVIAPHEQTEQSAPCVFVSSDEGRRVGAAVAPPPA